MVSTKEGGGAANCFDFSQGIPIFGETKTTFL